MPIISISLSEQALTELDAAQKRSNFSGRSELIRAALAQYTQESARETMEPTKHYSASLSVVVAQTQRRAIHDALHSFHSLVRTQSHLCVDSERCMEILGLHGTGANIRALSETLERVPKVEKLTLSLEPCRDHEH
jgi:metal-responsive CopG/Arc/MetJ family transcriptional regulator